MGKKFDKEYFREYQRARKEAERKAYRDQVLKELAEKKQQSTVSNTVFSDWSSPPCTEQEKELLDSFVGPPSPNSLTFCVWVIPLVGDPIQIGPFKSKASTLKARYRTVKKLIAEKNAKDLDIRLLGMYEKGLLEDTD